MNAKQRISITISIFMLMNQTGFSLLLANSIEVDGTTKTKIEKAQNGVPIVDIAKPSAGGVSYNTYKKFNVDKSGLILNNSDQIGVSKLGGAINSNTNYAVGDKASVILNEVTSNQNSALNGATEIFGAKAEFILANPNGITCDGCGFINTNRVSLITGTPSFNGDNFDNKFQISSYGELIIQGLGLDARDATSLDLVSRIHKITGVVLTNGELNILAGNGEYDYNKNLIKSLITETSTGEKGLAIDASVFGSMYGGKINIISTESGMGVNSEGEMVAILDDLEISADGDIGYKNLFSKKNINLKTTKTIQGKEGIAYANEGITLTAKSGIIQGNIESKSLDFNGDSIDIQETSEVNSQAIVLDSKKLINSGEIHGTSLTVKENSTDIENSGVVKVDELEIKAKNINNSGAIISQNSFDMEASKVELSSSSKIGSTNQVTNLTSEEIDNSGLIYGNTGVKIDGKLDNKGALISDSELSVSKDLINSGTVKGTDVKLGSTENSIEITNSGEITSTELALYGTTLTNSGDILANEDFIFDVTSATLTAGSQIGSKTSSAIISGENLNNSGLIIGNGGLTLHNNIVNSGTIYSGGIINYIGDLENSGWIESTTASTFAGDIFENSGTVLSNEGIDFKTSSFTNSGSIQGTTASFGESDNRIDLTNSGKITVESLNSFSNDMTNSGSIVSSNKLSIDTKTGTFTETSQLGSENLAIELKGDSITNSGLISGNDGVRVDSNIENSGVIYSGNGLDFTKEVDNSGHLEGVNKISFGGNKMENSGVILTSKDIDFQSSEITNSGTIEGSGLSFGSADNRVTFTNTNVINSQDLTVYGSLVTNSGNLVSGNSFLIDSTTMDFGQTSQIGSQSTKTDLKGDINNQGLVFGATDINIDGIIDNSGVLLSSDTINFKKDTTNSGVVQSATLNFGEADNKISIDNSGEISSTGLGLFINKLTNNGAFLTTNDFDLDAGTITLGEDSQIGSQTAMTTLKSDSITNKGLILGTTGVSIDGAINNSGNLVSFDSITTSEDDFTNSGNIQAVNTIILNGVIDNSGDIKSNEITVGNKETSIETFTNSGTFESDNLKLYSLSTTNSGSLLGDNQLFIKSNLFEQTSGGKIGSKEDIVSLHSGTINNDGLIVSAKNMTVTTDNLTNKTNGQIITDSFIYLNSSDSLNNKGLIGGTNVNLTGNKVDNYGKFLTSGNIDLSASVFKNHSGSKISGERTNIIASSFTQNGEVFGNSKITVNSNGFSMNNDKFNTGFNGEILFNMQNGNFNMNTNWNTNSKVTFENVNTFNNHGNIQTTNMLAVKSKKLNNNGHTLGGKKALWIKSDQIDNTGKFVSDTGVTLEMNQDLNYKSGGVTIESGRDMTYIDIGEHTFTVNKHLYGHWLMLGAKDIINNGKAISGSALSLGASNKFENKSGGLIYGDRVSVKGGKTLINAPSSTIYGNVNAITMSDDFQNSGKIESKKFIWLKGPYTKNNSGSKVSSKGNIRTSGTVDNYGTILAEKKIFVGGPLDNKGSKAENADVTLSNQKGGGTLGSVNLSAGVKEKSVVDPLAYLNLVSTGTNTINYQLDEIEQQDKSLTQESSATSTDTTLDENSKITAKDVSIDSDPKEVANVPTSGDNTQTLEVDNYKMGDVTNINQMFKINENLNKEKNYIIESRVEFTDVNKLMGSKYFLDKIGYSIDDEVKNLGDNFVEQKIIFDSATTAGVDVGSTNED
ncbi:MAG: filamentous hemagglutinin N-terminal domain-containing protein, partial [Campylobacterales bacterium]|nr:filamentous hemagglutinin N-terminal domain-containing protein [Campylobacterales bacterium]